MVVAPGIYDAYGARLVQQAGFEAVYMTGNGVSASLLGRPDVGLVDLTLLSQQAHRAAACIDIPLICDADTGYGNAVNVKHTVREFEAAGVAAIHLEDQVSPKRCGHLPGSRPVIDAREAIGKIEAAAAARRDPDFIIIARTDSASGLGLDEAIRRGNAYRKAGADVVFVELKGSPDIVDVLKRVTAEVDAPCLVNVEDAGNIGDLTTEQLDQMGFRVAIYPGLGRNAAAWGIRNALGALKGSGNTKPARGSMLTFREYNEVLDLAEVEEWEKRYLLR